LTKQGVLPLTFLNEADYSLISAGDIISTSGLDALLRGDLSSEVKVLVQKAVGGEIVEIKTDHALSKDQVRSYFSRFPRFLD
jgi:aconitase A